MILSSNKQFPINKHVPLHWWCNLPIWGWRGIFNDINKENPSHTHTWTNQEFCAILPSSDTNKDYLCDSHTKIRSIILYKIYRKLWTIFHKFLIWDPDKEMILQLQEPKYRPNEKSDQNHSMQQICFQRPANEISTGFSTWPK